MRLLQVAGLIAIAALSSVPASTQDGQAATATFSSSSELVLVPTVVNDKSGIHMSGLTKQDFVLRQDGKTRSISVFEEVRTDSSRAHRSSGAGGLSATSTWSAVLTVVLASSFWISSIPLLQIRQARERR